MKDVALDVDASLSVLVRDELHVFDRGDGNAAIVVIADVLLVLRVFKGHIVHEAVKQRRFRFAKVLDRLLLETLR